MRSILKVLTPFILAGGVLSLAPTASFAADSPTEGRTFVGRSSSLDVARAQAERRMNAFGDCTVVRTEQAHPVLGSWTYTIYAECAPFDSAA
ncbi:hypothetical protein [Streptomyces sp. NPDC059918]|uniref:hypothetical protein n=1 Tax=unclassified Streptomyces TaxID=2593676 RepID=UPI0036534BDD